MGADPEFRRVLIKFGLGIKNGYIFNSIVYTCICNMGGASGDMCKVVNGMYFT